MTTFTDSSRRPRRNSTAGICLITATLALCSCTTTKLDRESRECLGCHRAGGATTTVHAVDLQSDHRVGVRYAEFAHREDYVDRPALPMPAGRITCATCHEPFAGNQTAHGNIRLKAGTLCSACHRL